MTTSTLPGLESGHDDKEARTGSALARGSLAAGTGCHAPDASSPAADARRDDAEEAEEEITPEMIRAAISALTEPLYEPWVNGPFIEWMEVVTNGGQSNEVIRRLLAKLRQAMKSAASIPAQPS